METFIDILRIVAGVLVLLWGLASLPEFVRDTVIGVALMVAGIALIVGLSRF